MSGIDPKALLDYGLRFGPIILGIMGSWYALQNDVKNLKNDVARLTDVVERLETPDLSGPTRPVR